MDPTLWIYESDKGWMGHIDWHDGKPIVRQGPFDSEGQAARVISRMNGKMPPPEYDDE